MLPGKVDTARLNIASIIPQTRALGPGLRAVIWVQGCPLNCRGCVAPNWIPFTPAMLMTPEMIIDRLSVPSLDGITLSGGEPMEQAEGLSALVDQIRAIKNINIICFTGYRFERLVKNPPNSGVEKLLASVDVLIDGPYIDSQNDSIGLRGSSNQRIIQLTSRLSGYALETQKRNVEVTIKDGEIAFVGIPTPGVKNALDMLSQTSVKRM